MSASQIHGDHLREDRDSHRPHSPAEQTQSFAGPCGICRKAETTLKLFDTTMLHVVETWATVEFNNPKAGKCRWSTEDHIVHAAQEVQRIRAMECICRPVHRATRNDDLTEEPSEIHEQPQQMEETHHQEYYGRPLGGEYPPGTPGQDHHGHHPAFPRCPPCGSPTPGLDSLDSLDNDRYTSGGHHLKSFWSP